MRLLRRLRPNRRDRPTPIHRTDWVDVAMIGLAAALVIVTVAMQAIPGFHAHIAAPAIDLVLDTTAMVVTATVAALAWARFAEHRQPVAHAEAAAFLALAFVNGVAVAVSVFNYPGTNESLMRAGETQAYIFTAGRFLAATLLVFGGVSSLLGRPPRFPVAMLVAPVVVLGVVIAVVATVGDRLPPLVVANPGAGLVGQPDVVTTLVGVLAQVGGAAMTMAAAVVWHRLWHRDGAVSHAYLTLGLIIASFAQLHSVLFPGVHPLQVSSGDLLWLAFGALLVLSTEAESRTALAELRKANGALEELREVEVDRAGLEERARLSRELHDGLAQDLWLAKLKVGRLASMPHLDEEATVLAREVAGAIDAGLAEAGQAVMALRQGTGETHAPLCELMHRFVDDFADRFGVRTEFECDHSAPRLSHRVEAEVLRIAQEAFNNLRRHADATLVRVLFETRDGMVTVVVGDNGRGFDVASVGDGGYGLAGMRERAELINGRLTIESRPQDGTRVTIQVPVDGPIPFRRAG